MYSVPTVLNRLLTLSCRTTYIHRAARYLKSRTTYICRNQCDEVWSNFVHSYFEYCGVRLCCGLLKVRASLCSGSGHPLPPQQASLLYVNTYQLRIYPS